LCAPPGLKPDWKWMWRHLEIIVVCACMRDIQVSPTLTRSSIELVVWVSLFGLPKHWRSRQQQQCEFWFLF
jgi:hypothetical protein